MNAFFAHANMQNEELKSLLLDFTQHYVKNGVDGYGFSEDEKSVSAVTAGFGGNFRMYNWREMSGCIQMRNGD